MNGKSRLASALGLCVAAALTIAAADVGSQEPASSGGPATFRRLTEDQYKRSIAQIFGPDIVVPGRFEPPVREGGLLAIGSANVIVTPAGFEQYALRGKEEAAQVLDDKHRSATLPCAVKDTPAFDQACARQFFVKYGRLLFRRPLSAGELASATMLSQRITKSSGSFVKGMTSGLEQLLISPSFIFRLETAEPDPAHAGSKRLDVWSYATRLSFLLWDAPPDEELLEAAASGELRFPAGQQEQFERLMASPKLEQGVRAFFSDMLAYDQFSGLSKDPSLFPVFSPQLRKDAQEQSLRTIVDHLLTQQGDYRDLFTTKKTFLTRSLGALYGVPVDYRGFSGWMPYAFPADDPHSGLLTLPAFLMLDPSHEGRSSPTIRGKVVRENFLCQPVPMPPANVNFRLVQNVNDPVLRTARMRLKAHSEDETCAACHKITDPIGLGLENFTAVGAYRDKENGVPIDASGIFEGKPYRNAVEFSALLHDSPSVPACVVQRAFEYGVGRQPQPGEEVWLDYASQRFAADGYRFPALLRRIASSPAFQAVSPGTVALNNH